MKALIKKAKGLGELYFEDCAIPKIVNPDDVLIKVEYAGVCGTDLHIQNDEFTYYPPVILGHEFSGTIQRTGKDVIEFEAGDRIVGEPHAKACMTCDVCVRGYPQICKSKRSPGWGQNGAFAEYIVLSEKLLHKIPEGVSLETAAMIEPLAIVVHQVLERGKVNNGDVVGTIGAGTMGILSAFAAKYAGASKVIILGIETDEFIRFGIAKQLGADHTIDVTKVNVEDRILDITSGKKCDLVVEASGSPAGIIEGFNIVRELGRITAIGLTGRDSVEIPWDMACQKVLDISFNMSSSHSSWIKALDIMSNTTLDLSNIITHREPLSNWEETFSIVRDAKGLKAIFDLSLNRE